MRNNKGDFFRTRVNGASAKVASAAVRHLSTTLTSIKGKSGESLRNNNKPLKRRGLKRPSISLGKAKEAAAAGLASQTNAVRRVA
jgi:hypothetical protein